jgi:hypothetical protein
MDAAKDLPLHISYPNAKIYKRGNSPERDIEINGRRNGWMDGSVGKLCRH